MISNESELTKRCPYLAASELRQMARLAWRNSHRCIGRLLWNSLELLDARDATTSRNVFEACIQHLKHATNGGRIRSTITVFQEAETEEMGVRIWNQQLIRYAGYEAADGSILGDPRQAAFTRRVMAMGWVPPTRRGAFDVLPLVIQVPGESPCIYQIPPEAILEVPLSHPEFPWFAGLNLRWHALPVISDMALVGEGRRFTAAPFNGYYMGTEIASRNLGDEQRYNLLPIVAANMKIDVRSSRSLWKDRALVELNAAVLHSFHEAGVTMVDHHSASAQFMQHLRNEESCGREVPGDWSWLVPPMSGSACPVFHRTYNESRPEPAFIEQQALWH